MKFAGHTDPTVSQIAVGFVSSLMRDHVEYMQKHKTVLQKLEKASTIPQVREMAHDMILILEGKRYSQTCLKRSPVLINYLFI